MVKLYSINNQNSDHQCKFICKVGNVSLEATSKLLGLLIIIFNSPPHTLEMFCIQDHSSKYLIWVFSVRLEK